MNYETILYEEDGPLGWLTLNRPDDGNMFTATMCREVCDCIEGIRRETRTRVLVITGAGERFFCLGGRTDERACPHGGGPWLVRPGRDQGCLPRAAQRRDGDEPGQSRSAAPQLPQERRGARAVRGVRRQAPS